MIIQVVNSAGVVVDAKLVPDGSTLAADGSQITLAGGLVITAAQWAGARLTSQAGAGIGWTLSGGALVSPPATTAPSPLL